MPSEVPAGWRLVSYSEATYVNRESLPGSTRRDEIIRYLDISSVLSPGVLGEPSVMPFSTAPSRARRVLRSGDTLVSCVRPYLRSFAFLRGDATNLVASTGFAVLSPRPGVDPEFLYQTVWRESFLAFLSERMTGSNYPAVTAADVGAASLLLPPLSEQKKIAAILSSVDEAIQATQAVINQTRRVKEGLLQDLLTRGIGHTRFKKTEIGEIPESWEVQSIGELFHVQLGKMMSEDARKGTNQKPYLRNINVRWRHIVLDELDTISFDSREMLKFALRIGDILMCEGGTIGRSAIWNGEIAECYYQKALHRLRSRGAMLPEFLLNYAFLAFEVSDIFRGDRLASTIPHLTKERLEKLPVPVPPIHEQVVIVARLESLWEEEEFGNEVVGSLVSLKSALLDDLLTGRVRVTP